MGIKDLKKKYNIEDMIKGDVIFCASGITNGDLVKGISVSNGNFEVSTLALHKSQDIKKIVINTYKK
jgi:fructose-1,6-bisphosphatase II / sedoheptulose-1,7-bisphosphatase